jgi:hypothetical protein
MATQFMWHDLVGSLGVAAVLGAYLLLQTGRLSASRRTYSAVNGAGAALILVSLYYSFNLSAFLVEFFWLLISIYGFFKAAR